MIGTQGEFGESGSLIFSALPPNYPIENLLVMKAIDHSIVKGQPMELRLG